MWKNYFLYRRQQMAVCCERHVVFVYFSTLSHPFVHLAVCWYRQQVWKRNSVSSEHVHLKSLAVLTSPLHTETDHLLMKFHWVWHVHLSQPVSWELLSLYHMDLFRDGCQRSAFLLEIPIPLLRTRHQWSWLLVLCGAQSEKWIKHCIHMPLTMFKWPMHWSVVLHENNVLRHY